MSFPVLEHAAKSARHTTFYLSCGVASATPIVLLHGWQGSRLFCPDESATDAAHVRLITIDRPGFGRSDPQPDRSLLDWVDDFAELARLLELPPSPMVGWSGGGPYALACAARIPDRVPKVGVAATDGPWDEVPGALNELSHEMRGLVELLPRDPVAANEGFRQRCQWYADDWEGMFADVGSHPDDPDDQLMVRPEIIEPLKVWMREGARQGSSGYVTDVIAEFRPWGFSGFRSVHRRPMKYSPGARNCWAAFCSSCLVRPRLVR